MTQNIGLYMSFRGNQAYWFKMEGYVRHLGPHKTQSDSRLLTSTQSNLHRITSYCFHPFSFLVLSTVCNLDLSSTKSVAN